MECRVEPFSLRHIYFQHKYKLGFKYLDVTGSALCALLTQYPQLKVQEVNAVAATLKNEKFPSISLAFGADSASVTQVDIDIRELEAFSCAVGLQVPTILDFIKPGDPVRMGIRTIDIREVSSPEHGMKIIESKKWGSVDSFVGLLTGKPISYGRSIRSRASDGRVRRLVVSLVRITNNTEFSSDISAEDATDAKYGIAVDFDYQVWGTTISGENLIKEALIERKAVHERVGEVK